MSLRRYHGTTPYRLMLKLKRISEPDPQKPKRKASKDLRKRADSRDSETSRQGISACPERDDKEQSNY